MKPQDIVFAAGAGPEKSEKRVTGLLAAIPP